MFSDDELRLALSQYGGAECKELLNNPKLYKSLSDFLKSMMATGGLAKGMGVASSAASAGAAVLKSAGADPRLQQGVAVTSFMLSELKVSLDLSRLAQIRSPVAALAFTGATVVQKTGIAMSLAGNDRERARCVGAVMELAGSATITMVAAPTGVLAVLSAASLVASTVNAYQSCRGQF